MVSIPWWTWLGVGAIVTGVSIFADLTFFIWVGVIFIVVGVSKLAMFYILGSREEPQVQSRLHVSPRVQQYSNPQRALCPRCMANVSPADFYCRYCGTRVR